MKNINITVTRPYLPPLDEYINEVSEVWNIHCLTHYGPLNNKLILNLK